MLTTKFRRLILGSLTYTFDFDNPPAGQPCRAIDCRIHYRVTPREIGDMRLGAALDGPTNEIQRVEVLALHVMDCNDPTEWSTWQADALPAGVTAEGLACEVLTAIGADDRLAERIDWACMEKAGEV